MRWTCKQLLLERKTWVRRKSHDNKAVLTHCRKCILFYTSCFLLIIKERNGRALRKRCVWGGGNSGRRKVLSCEKVSCTIQANKLWRKNTELYIILQRCAFWQLFGCWCSELKRKSLEPHFSKPFCDTRIEHVNPRVTSTAQIKATDASVGFSATLLRLSFLWQLVFMHSGRLIGAKS